jgi:hypothetical protein
MQTSARTLENISVLAEASLSIFEGQFNHER